MIAESILTPDERRAINRQHALFEVYALTTTGLSDRGERDVRAAIERHLDAILALADDATAALAELEANEARLSRHQPGCNVCVPLAPCLRYRVLSRRRERLQATADRAYRALQRGRR